MALVYPYKSSIFTQMLQADAPCSRRNDAVTIAAVYRLHGIPETRLSETRDTRMTASGQVVDNAPNPLGRTGCTEPVVLALMFLRYWTRYDMVYSMPWKALRNRIHGLLFQATTTVTIMQESVCVQKSASSVAL